MHEQAENGVKCVVQYPSGHRPVVWKWYPATILQKPTGHKAKYLVEFDGEDGAYIKCPLVSGLETRKIPGVVEIKIAKKLTAEEARDQEEEEEEEEDKVPMEEDEEEEEEASEATSDQGYKIGEFWSGIDYKEGKYTVRVVGHVVDDTYWVRQWQPKKLGFKGKNWEQKAIYIKEKK